MVCCAAPGCVAADRTADSLDAAAKVARSEGVAALFKGWFAHYLRGAPHVALLFVTFEQLKARRPFG